MIRGILAIVILAGVSLSQISCVKTIDGFSEDDIKIEIDFRRKLNHNTEYLIIVTLDGYRWQEVFGGADEQLLFVDSINTSSRKDRIEKYWADTPQERRKKLMPFFWNTIATEGKLYGNRHFGNNVGVSNVSNLTYPGFNEMFSGYPDPNYKSNERIMNPNINIFEILNELPEYEDKIGIFTRGGGFPYILNRERNNLYMVSGIEENESTAKDSLAKELLNKLNQEYTFYDDSKYKHIVDRLVYINAKSYLITNRPKVLFIAFLNTDAFGHRNEYDKYLATAYNINLYIQDLWNYIQSDSLYKDKTTLFITTDHGRGVGSEWQYHGTGRKHSDETWCAMIGPDTRALGEIKKRTQIYQKQYAKSFLAFLGFETHKNPNIGDRVKEFMDR